MEHFVNVQIYLPMQYDLRSYGGLEFRRFAWLRKAFSKRNSHLVEAKVLLYSSGGEEYLSIARHNEDESVQSLGQQIVIVGFWQYENSSAIHTACFMICGHNNFHLK